MNRIRHKQKVGDNTMVYNEEVLFNTDTLSKIISCLPSIDLLSLALTNKRFGISLNEEGKSSIIEESVCIAIQDIATEEELDTLPHYNGQNVLADYHYLQLMRKPLTFDQLVGAEYVNKEDKSSVKNSGNGYWEAAISNNILMAGKHYASFKSLCDHRFFMTGVMRPGQANQNARDLPISKEFYQNFSRTHVGRHNNNNVRCCLYYAYTGFCYSSDWREPDQNIAERWDGSERMSSGDDLGLLLDLDEATISLYKNERKLGVMKRGLAGPYCWVVSMGERNSQVTIKRGTVPP